MRDLTAAEQEVVDILGNAYSKFAYLPPVHPRDHDEFVLAIHAAQNIVLARPAFETQHWIELIKPTLSAPRSSRPT